MVPGGPRDLSRKFPEALIQERISRVDSSLARLQAPVFIVHVIHRSDRPNEAYLNGLRQLSMTTGGVAVVCRSNGEIASALKDVLANITTHYSVTVELPKARAPSVELKLSVSRQDGSSPGLGYRSRFVLKK